AVPGDPAVADRGPEDREAVRAHGRLLRPGARRGSSRAVIGQWVSRQRFVMGSRRSRPNALNVIFVPGGYCLRLYSALSTMRTTLSITSASNPAANRSA